MDVGKEGKGERGESGGIYLRILPLAARRNVVVVESRAAETIRQNEASKLQRSRESIARSAFTGETSGAFRVLRHLRSVPAPSSPSDPFICLFVYMYIYMQYSTVALTRTNICVLRTYTQFRPSAV